MVETTWADTLRIGAIAPDFLALTAAVWLIAAHSPYGFLATGSIGFVADLLGSGRLGIGTGAWLIIGYAITRLRWRWAFDHLAVQVVMVALTVSAWAMAVGLTQRFTGDIAVRALGTGIYTSIIALPILLVLGWTRCIAGDRDGRPYD